MRSGVGGEGIADDCVRRDWRVGGRAGGGGGGGVEEGGSDMVRSLWFEYTGLVSLVHLFRGNEDGRLGQGNHS